MFIIVQKLCSFMHKSFLNPKTTYMNWPATFYLCNCKQLNKGDHNCPLLCPLIIKIRIKLIHISIHTIKAGLKCSMFIWHLNTSWTCNLWCSGITFTDKNSIPSTQILLKHNAYSHCKLSSWRCTMSVISDLPVLRTNFEDSSISIHSEAISGKGNNNLKLLMHRSKIKVMARWHRWSNRNKLEWSRKRSGTEPEINPWM